MNSFLFPLISVLFIIGTVTITQQLMHNYFSFKNLLPIFISALYNYQDIYSFHSCSESDNFCVFCPHWLNKYFVLSTFYTFYLHINIRKDYTHHAKTTDSIKKFPAPASRSDHLGYRFCSSKRRDEIRRRLYF